MQQSHYCTSHPKSFDRRHNKPYPCAIRAQADGCASTTTSTMRNSYTTAGATSMAFSLREPPSPTASGLPAIFRLQFLSLMYQQLEDLDKTRQLVRQARAAGLTKFQTPFLLTPGSEKIRATAEADGIFEELQDAGAVVLSSFCGPCVGSWNRKDVDVRGKEKNSVISSFNRNFVGRHDSNPATHSFVTSPELVTAFAYAGRLDFNPITDSIPREDNQGPFRFSPPVSREFPLGFEAVAETFQEPLADGSSESVIVDPQSDRFQLLTPFAAWQPGCTDDMELLIKAQGKCTTSEVRVVPEVARDLQHRGIRWCIIDDHNYGEDSSREHAALEPRYLGGVAIIACSFARIHETNLRKQGMLPLTFDDSSDYDRIQDGDRIRLIGVEDMAGIAGSYWINYASQSVIPATSNWEWRITMILQLIPSIMLFLDLDFFPESPRYLMMRERVEAAKKSLSRLRGDLDETSEYFTRKMDALRTKMDANVESQSAWDAIKSLMKLCIHHALTRKVVLFVTLIQLFFIFSGGNSITYYSPTILQSIGLNSRQVLLFTAVYGCIKLASVFLYAFALTDRFGRRPLLTGSTTNLICLIYLAAFLGSNGISASAGPSPAAWIVIVAICVFAIGYGFGWAPAFSLTASEICPTSIRGTVVTIAFIFQNLLNFAVTRGFPNMTLSMHSYGPFALFSAFTFCGTV